jgi:hypothetical protein
VHVYKALSCSFVLHSYSRIPFLSLSFCSVDSWSSSSGPTLLRPSPAHYLSPRACAKFAPKSTVPASSTSRMRMRVVALAPRQPTSRRTLSCAQIASVLHRGLRRATAGHHRREAFIEVSVARAVDSLSAAANNNKEAPSDSAGLAESLRAVCAWIDSPMFLGLVVARRTHCGPRCPPPRAQALRGSGQVRHGRGHQHLPRRTPRGEEPGRPGLGMRAHPRGRAAGSRPTQTRRSVRRARWCRGPRGRVRVPWPRSGRRLPSGREGWKGPWAWRSSDPTVLSAPGRRRRWKDREEPSAQ